MSTNNIYRMVRMGGPTRRSVRDLLSEAVGTQDKGDVQILAGMAKAMISTFPRYPVPVSVDTHGYDPATKKLIECAEMISDEGLSVLLKEAQKYNTPKTTSAKVFEFSGSGL